MTNFRKGDLVIYRKYDGKGTQRIATICAIDYARKRIGLSWGIEKSDSYPFYPIAGVKPLGASIDILRDLFGKNYSEGSRCYVYRWDLNPVVILQLDANTNQITLNVIQPDGIDVLYRNISYMHELQHCLEEQGIYLQELVEESQKTDEDYDR